VSAFALHELGIGALELGDLDDAARCLRRALSLLEGERTLRVAEIEVALARALFARGRPQEGVSLMLHAGEIVGEAVTPNHPARLEIERELGRIERPGSPYR
jgi:hypothetical protein